MKYLNLCFALVTLITLNSCSDQDIPISVGCDKLASREEAQNLMTTVRDIRFTDSLRIAENLIGEWGLIGMVPGWRGFESGQACIRLTIDSTKIILEDFNFGNNNTSEWKLKVSEVNGFTRFFLETNEETNEDVWIRRMGMEIFSNKIMFGSSQFEDGNTYIYEKRE